MIRQLLTSLFLLLCVHIPGSFAGEGTVTGRITLENGKPFEGQVFFFDASSNLERPVLNKFWRVPDFVEQASEAGAFSVVLPEGTYYLAAIQRMSDVIVGPPTDGDFLLPSHDKKGVYRSLQVIAGANTNVGSIKGVKRYSSRRDAYKGKITAIDGKLVRADGSPVDGMYVFAYTDSSMQGRPQFVSTRSNKDGSYRLLIDKGRIVYLRTREGYAGGSPRPGAPIGVYGGVDGQKPVASRTGKITSGYDIVVQPFAQRVN